MQLQTLEPPDDIALFIVEGTHRLATISMNDYGFLQSARMAQTYLGRASQVLETKQGIVYRSQHLENHGGGHALRICAI